jgi:3-oxoacyl-(acyl-carrier-protein) synthase III
MRPWPAPAALREVQVVGIGDYRPANVVDNAQAGAACGVGESWIRSRMGIARRRIASREETLEYMAVQAALNACKDAGVDASSVDCVLVATMSSGRQTPSLAPAVAHRIGADDALAYDLTAACSGFCYTLAAARDHLRGGSARRALVIGTERMSDLVDAADPGTGPLFGDGAGAFLIAAAPPSLPASQAIGPVVWGSNGADRDVLRMSGSWAELLADPQAPRPRLLMDGPRVWLWVREEVVPAIRGILDADGVRERLAAFVPHQANGRMIRMLVDRLDLPPEVAVALDVHESANTSAASVPLALEQLRREGRVASGDLVLLFGFGAGLAYAGQLVTLP